MAAVPIFALLHSISQISIGAARHQITLTTAKPPNAIRCKGNPKQCSAYGLPNAILVQRFQRAKVGVHHRDVWTKVNPPNHS